MTDFSISAMYVPADNISLLLVPGCTDLLDIQLRNKSSSIEAVPVREPEPGSKILTVIRDPLERFQEFHRWYWIESRHGLPKSLRDAGFQSEWPAALVADHVSALVAAGAEIPGLLKPGRYSPQYVFWKDYEPEFLVHGTEGVDYSKHAKHSMLIYSPPRFKYAPAAMTGRIKDKLESVYAVDLAVYRKVLAERKEQQRAMQRLR